MAKKVNFLSYLKYEILSWIGLFPTTYYLYRWMKSRIAPLMTADIVIEGYPRSGNTFAQQAFLMAQEEPIQLFSHSHTPAQVKRAVRLGIPTLVLIRNPCDAVISMVIRHPDKGLSQALVHYIQFYSSVWGYRDSVVFGLFLDVSADFGVVIQDVNNHFGTGFKPFIPTPENIEECFRRIEVKHLNRLHLSEIDENVIARPSDDRKDIQQRLKLAILDPALEDYLTLANMWYEKILSYQLARRKDFSKGSPEYA